MKTRRAFSPFSRRTRTLDLLEEIRTRQEARAKWDQKSTKVEEVSAIEVILEETPSTLALEKYYRKDAASKSSKNTTLSTKEVKVTAPPSPSPKTNPRASPTTLPSVKHDKANEFQAKYSEKTPQAGTGHKRCTPIFGRKKALMCSKEEDQEEEPQSEESFAVKVTPTRSKQYQDSHRRVDGTSKDAIIDLPSPTKALDTTVDTVPSTPATPERTFTPPPNSTRCTPSFRRKQVDVISPERPRIVARIEANQPPDEKQLEALDGLRRVTSHVSEYGSGNEIANARRSENSSRLVGASEKGDVDDHSIGEDSMQVVLDALQQVEHNIQTGKTTNIQVKPKVLETLRRIADNIQDPREQQAMLREIGSWQVKTESSNRANDSFRLNKGSPGRFQRLQSTPDSVDEASFSQMLSIEDDAFSGSSYSRSRYEWHSHEGGASADDDEDHSTGQSQVSSPHIGGWGGRDNPYQVQEIDAPARAPLKPPRGYTNQDRSWWRKSHSPERANHSTSVAKAENIHSRYPHIHPFAPNEPIQREPSWFEAMSLGSIGSDQFSSSKKKQKETQRSLLDGSFDDFHTWDVDTRDGGLDFGVSLPVRNTGHDAASALATSEEI